MQEKREAIQAELSERHLHSFVRHAWHIVEPSTPFVDNWHIGCICEHLEAVTGRDITKLLVNIPPRHAKSLSVAVFWFCWVWAKYPASRWLFSSYAESLTSRDSVRCRDVIQSDWYQRWWGKKFQLKTDQNVKTWFANNKQGWRISTSTDGKGLGHGGDYIVTDDPHNGRDVWSDTQRSNVIEWWTQRMSTRGFPGRMRHVVIMQRLHEKDLSGYLLAEELGYEHLCLPARYEPKRVFYSREEAKKAGTKDPIVMTSLQVKKESTRDQRTQEGELLWKSVFDDKAMADWSKTLRAYGTAGQLQQRPAPAEGSIFQDKMFRKFREEVRNGKQCVLLDARESQIANLKFFQCIDTAMKIKNDNDWTVCGTYALTNTGDLLVWDVWRYRILVPYQFKALMTLRNGPCLWREASQDFYPLGTWPKALLFQAVEDKSSGIGLIQQAQAAGVPFKVLLGDNEPMERVSPIATAYYSGKVWHREGAAWLPDYESEHLAFPNGAHDDQVMVSAYAGYLMQHDTILRASIDRELLVSDKETAEAAEKLSKQSREGGYRITMPDGDVLDVDFGD